MSTDRLLDYWLTGTPPTGWMAQAACRDRPELPWTHDVDALPRVKGVAARMRAVCNGCPVRAECADFAVTTEATGGFWAGRWRSLAQVTTRRARTSDADAA